MEGIPLRLGVQLGLAQVRRSLDHFGIGAGGIPARFLVGFPAKIDSDDTC